MRYGVVFEETDYQRLRGQLLFDPGSEQAAYLLCGVSETSNEIRWLVREIIAVPAERFVRRERYGLTISAGFTDEVVQRARSESLAVVLTHSHPFDQGTTEYSPVDDRGEDGPLDIVRVIGRTISSPYCKAAGAISPVHARQVLAFGPGGQQRIAAATVAVVGVGGTGSITAEQLVRLGIGRIILIDADRIEASNVSRVFGSVQSDISAKRAKVEAFTRWAAQISPGTRVEAYARSVLESEIAAKIREADIIFGCTDNHTSR